MKLLINKRYLLSSASPWALIPPYTKLPPRLRLINCHYVWHLAPHWIFANFSREHENRARVGRLDPHSTCWWLKLHPVLRKGRVWLDSSPQLVFLTHTWCHHPLQYFTSCSSSPLPPFHSTAPLHWITFHIVLSGVQLWLQQIVMQVKATDITDMKLVRIIT